MLYPDVHHFLIIFVVEPFLLFPLLVCLIYVRSVKNGYDPLISTSVNIIGGGGAGVRVRGPLEKWILRCTAQQ